MLTPDVLFEGFTTEQWTRLLSLFQRAEVVGGARDGRIAGRGDGWVASTSSEPTRAGAPAGGVIALYDRRRAGTAVLRKLIHTHRGRLDPRQQPWPVSLAELVRRYDAQWAAELAVGALEELAERFGERARRDHDMSAQVALLLRIAHELRDEGLFRTYPRDIASIPLMSESTLTRALDAVCPDGGVATIAVFDGGDLWTAIALERRGRGFARILGPNALRPRMGLLSGDFRRDHRHLMAAVREIAGPLVFGCFTELSTLRALEQDAIPGAWARAVLVQDIILDPMPLSLSLPLLVDAARATWVALRGLREKMHWVRVLDSVLRGPSERA